MKYFDKFFEAVADWFMDFFLDPVYVLETSNGTIEVVSMNNQVFEPVMTTNEGDTTPSSNTGYAIVTLSEKLSAAVTTVTNKRAVITEAIADYYNKILTRVNLFDIEKEDQNYCLANPTWLTG